MKKISITIVLTRKLNKDGLMPIYLQFIKERKVNRISLNHFIHPEAWKDEDGQFVIEEGSFAPEDAVNLNLQLNNKLLFAKDILSKAQKDKEEISFRKFKTSFLKEKNQNFIRFCEAELERRDQLKKYSPETLRGNRSRLNKLRRFAPDLLFADIDVNFLEDFEIHMRTNLDNDVNTVYGSMKFIRTMLNAAKRRNLTNVYPF
jgi:hypothetical protein